MVQVRHVDKLDVSTLTPMLLNDYYGSEVQRQDVLKVAEEIKRRHLAILPTETGRLKSTATVSAKRSTTHPDRRYEAEYSIGGPRAPYIVPLEDEHHYLDRVLNEMGFFVGDNVSGPTGKVAPQKREPTVRLYHRTSSEAADAIVREGYQVKNTKVKGRNEAFFTDQPGALPQYGPDVVFADVPRSYVQDSHGAGSFEVDARHLEGLKFSRHIEAAEAEARQVSDSGHASRYGGIAYRSSEPSTPEREAERAASAARGREQVLRRIAEQGRT